MDANNQRINLDAVKAFRRKVRRKIAFRIILFVLPFIFLCAYGAVYIARLPRERHARSYTFAQKLRLGLGRALKATYLKMSTPLPDPKRSKIPIVELYIKGKRLDKLNSNLPQSGRVFQKALLKADGQIYKVKARYKGDSINHWAFPNKSWRIELRNGKRNRKEKVFNLNVPRTKTQISNWLGFELGSVMNGVAGGGPLVPKADFVHFRLNRLFDGVRLRVEQPDQNFIRVRNLEPGTIFSGDIRSRDIYSGKPRKRLYSDLSAWTVDSPYIESGKSALASLIHLIRYQHKPYDFYYEIEKLMNLDAIVQYMALLELVGTTHVDNTHNNKFYLNPISGRLTPIVWDSIAYFWGNNKGLDLGSNDLFKKILSIPSLREQKDLYLWEAVNGELSSERIIRIVKRKIREIAPDVRAFPLKIHASDKGIYNISNEEWKAAIGELINAIRARGKFIRRELSATDVRYNFRTVKEGSKSIFRVVFQVNSRAGFRLKGITLKLNAQKKGQIVTLKRWGIEDVKKVIKPRFSSQKASSTSSGTVSFPLNEVLYSKRRTKKGVTLVPGVYVYDFVTEEPLKILSVISIKGKNSITKKGYKPIYSKKLEIPSAHKQNSIWWDPKVVTEKSIVRLSGKVVLTKDLVITPYQSLDVSPGTHIAMAKGVSIIVNGGDAYLRGSSTQPIVIEGDKGKALWGVMAISGGECKISNVNIIGGSEKNTGIVFYPSSLTIFNSHCLIDKLNMSRGYITAAYSDLTLKNSRFSNIFGISVSATNSIVNEEGNKIFGLKKIYNKSLFNSPPVGTPPRIEREFKYTIKASGKKAASKIAKAISKALKAAVSNPALWKAPSRVGSRYYIDSAPETFAFRDIYFDTSDYLAYANSISFRLRNRYKSIKAHNLNISKPKDPDYWPYRIEFQAKVGRKELGHGFSSVKESRFEFRKESPPFGPERLPPRRPWKLKEFIGWFEAGNYKGLITYPAVEIYRYLKSATGRDEFEFRPKLVLVTERRRIHINMKTPWGSGPNPDQAFIISLDNSHAFSAADYLGYLDLKESGVKAKKPSSLADLFEVEVEFERNVSDKLDSEIASLTENAPPKQAQRLLNIRKAFLADQTKIMDVIKESLGAKSFKVLPASASKYVQAVDNI